MVVNPFFLWMRFCPRFCPRFSKTSAAIPVHSLTCSSYICCGRITACRTTNAALTNAAPLTTTHSRTRVPPPEPRGEAAGGVCAPGFLSFCGVSRRDSGGRLLSGGRRASPFRRASARRQASSRSRAPARTARAAEGMALLRSLSPQVLGTRVVLFVEVLLFHARAGRAQAHDRPVLYTGAVQSSLQAVYHGTSASLRRRADERRRVPPARVARRGLEAGVLARHAHARAEEGGCR